MNKTTLKFIALFSIIFVFINTSCTAVEDTSVSDAESIELLSGNDQTALAGALLETPIEVLVKDQFNHAFAETIVRFSVTEGSVSSATAKTDARGIASVNWTLGQSTGTQTLTISAFKKDGTTALAPLSIIANVEAIQQEAASLALVSGNNQTGLIENALSAPIIVIVKDDNDVPVAGATVTVLVNDGSVTSSALTTDTNGLASINWTLGDTIGEQTISVMSFKPDGTTPLSGSPLTITANVSSESPIADILQLVSGGNQSGTVGEPLANPIIIRVLDQFENPFEGALVSVLIVVNELPFTLISDTNGLVSINWTLSGLVNTQDMIVKAFKADGTTPLTGSPIAITATGEAAIAADVLINTSGDNQTGTVSTMLTSPIVVRVLDQFENPFVGATVNFATTDGSLSASSGISDASGNVSVNWTLGTTVGTQTLSVTAFKPDGTTPLTGSPLIITANGSAALGADILVLVSGGSQEGLINTSLAEPIVVRILDQFENPFAGATVFFTPTNGSVSTQTVITNSNGEAETSWTLGSEITDQLLTVSAFKADGTTPLSGSSISIFVSAQAPLAIGDYYEGGVIFYLDNSGEHGLVCAVSNQVDNTPWGCVGTLITGADGTAIGTGAQNTLDIIAGCLESLIAAEWCSSLALNGYSDWFLPSQGELNEMFANKTAIDTTATSFGGAVLDTNFYWSSTEITANSAWGYNVFGDDGKSNNYAVRAVRAF